MAMTAAAEDAAAPLHLLKMAVGIASLDELREARARRIVQLGGSWVYTRNRPRRAERVLAGGSLYWVIRGQIRVRQRITGFDTRRDDTGRGYCLIAVEPALVATLTRPWRPFQGWRYLMEADAPPDLSAISPPEGAGLLPDEPMPARLAAELRALGLL
jgi:hypothetical protein